MQCNDAAEGTVCHTPPHHMCSSAGWCLIPRNAAADEAVLESAGPSDSESTAQQDCNELRPEVQVDLNESQMAATAEIEAQVEEAVQAAEAREVAEEAEMEAAVAMDTLLARVEADSLALSAPEATTTLQISPAEELTSLEEADREVTPEPRELSGTLPAMCSCECSRWAGTRSCTHIFQPAVCTRSRCRRWCDPQPHHLGRQRQRDHHH